MSKINQNKSSKKAKSQSEDKEQKEQKEQQEVELNAVFNPFNSICQILKVPTSEQQFKRRGNYTSNNKYSLTAVGSRVKFYSN